MLRKKVLVHFAVVLSLLNGAIAPARAQAPLDPPPGFTVEQWKFLNERKLQEFTSLLNSVRTADDYDRAFASALSPRDRAAVMKIALQKKKFPRMQREGTRLTAEIDGVKVRFEWPDVREAKLKVNDLDWTYDPTRPLDDQVRYLIKRLDANKKYSALETLFFPRAHAVAWAVVIPVITTAVSIVANGVIAFKVNQLGSADADKIYFEGCEADLKKNAKHLPTLARCQRYIKALKEAAVLDGPRSNAIKKQKTEGGANTIAKYSEIPHQPKLCPDNNDGKDLVYLASVCKTNPQKKRECAKDPVTGKEDHFKVYAKWDAKTGDPTEWLITDEEVDPLKPNPKVRKKMHFVGDLFDCLTLPNKEFPKKGDEYHKPVCSAAVTPQEKELLDSFKESGDLVAFVDSMANHCIVDTIEDKKNRGEEPGAPGSAVQPGTKEPGAVQESQSPPI